MAGILQRGISRRSIPLSTASCLLAATSKAHAHHHRRSVCPGSPTGQSSNAAKLGPWEFFTAEEGRAMEALADRIIPPDPQTPGGKDSGSAVFVDRQLGRRLRRSGRAVVRPPFITARRTRAPSPKADPRKEYREGLAALDRACQAREGGKRFADLSDERKDQVLKDLEEGNSSSKASMERPSSRWRSRTCRRASSPIRSTAAIATWPPGR